MTEQNELYDIDVTDIKGESRRMEDYRGQVLLIVNTASKCGFTPQYKALESLHRDYHDQGLRVLGFPCNQFGGQEPGSEEQIEQFCSLNFDVSFELFAKVDVNGSDAHPLFQHLTSEAKGLLGSQRIKWNFTKFLVDRQGQVRERYAPTTDPESMRRDIEALLAEPA